MPRVRDTGAVFLLLQFQHPRRKPERQHQCVYYPQPQRARDGFGLHLPGAQRRHVHAAQNVHRNLQRRLLKRLDNAPVHVEVVREYAPDGALIGIDPLLATICLIIFTSVLCPILLKLVFRHDSTGGDHRPDVDKKPRAASIGAEAIENVQMDNAVRLPQQTPSVLPG